jgi:hypothetical protein
MGVVESEPSWADGRVVGYMYGQWNVKEFASAGGSPQQTLDEIGHITSRQPAHSCGLLNRMIFYYHILFKFFRALFSKNMFLIFVLY